MSSSPTAGVSSPTAADMYPSIPAQSGPGRPASPSHPQHSSTHDTNTPTDIPSYHDIDSTPLTMSSPPSLPTSFALLLFLLILANQIQICLSLDNSQLQLIILPGCLMIVVAVIYPIMRYHHGALKTEGYVDLYVRSNKYLRFLFYMASLPLHLTFILYILMDSSEHILLDIISDRQLIIVIVYTCQHLCMMGILIGYWRLGKTYMEMEDSEHVLISSVVASPRLITSGINPHTQTSTNRVHTTVHVHSSYQALGNGDMPQPVQYNTDSPRSPHSTLAKQSAYITQLEQSLRDTQHELQRVRTSLHQQTAELRGLGVGSIGNLVNGSGKGKGGVIGGGGGKISADLDSLVSSKDGEIRALKLELHRVRQNLTRLSEEMTEISHQRDILKKECEEARIQEEKYKKIMRKLTKDNEKLTIMLQVHKQTNMDMQQAISEATASPQIRSPLLPRDS